MAKTTDTIPIWLGSKGNKKQGIVAIPAQATANKPGLLFLEAVDGSGVLQDGLYLWADSSDALRYHTSVPTDEDSTGTVIGASVANAVTATAVITDHTLVRGHGGARITQETGLTVDDSDNLSGVGTVGCGAITTTGAFTFSGANPDIIGGDTDGILSITADTATNQGGNIKLHGNTATAAQDIAFYADATLVLEWDESESNWDFSSKNIKGVGTLASGDITVDSALVFSAGSITDTSNAISFGDEALSTSGACTFSGTVATGALTVTGAASATTTITAGTDIISTAGYISLGDKKQLRLGASGASDSYIQYDSDNDDLEFYDRSIGGPYTLTELLSGTPLNPVVVGDLTIGDGQFDWTNATAGDVATWTFASTGTTCIDVIANQQSTGIILDINADVIDSGTFIHLDTDENDGAFKFLDCHDGGGSTFSVALHGATVIGGSDGGTAALTLTKGDLVISDGIINVDLDSNHGALNVNRNYTGAASTPVAYIKEDYDGAHAAALQVVSDETGAYDTVIVDHAGTEAAVLTNVINTAGDGVEVVLASGATGNGIFIDGTTTNGYVGAATAGMLHLKQDGTMTNAAASALRVDYDGTPAASALGYAINVDDDGDATASTYAVSIHSAANTPLKLETGGVTKQTLVLEATAAQTASTLLVDGATNDWDGAAATGMIHVSQDAAMNNAGASCIYVAHSGTPITTATGFMAAFVDTGSNQAGTYGVDINSTSNHPLRVRTGAVGVTPATILPHTNATAAGLIVNGNTNSWLGAAGTGLVQITQLGTFADTTASALFIDVNGDAATGGEGYALYIDDESDTTGGGEYAVYVNSKAGSPMKLEGQAVGMSTLVLEAGALQTASTLLVDGDTNNWTGANDAGMVKIQNDSTVQNAGASLLVLDMNGQGSSGMEGTCLRALDTGSAAASTSYAAEIASTNNNALQISTGSVGKAALTIIPHTNATASAVIIDGNAHGWGGASNVGMVHLKNDIAGLNANASSLLITKDANTVAEVNSAEGSCLRIVENMNVAATPPAYAMYISCVDNEALHVDSGNVVVDEYVTAGVAGSTTGGLVTAYYSADLTDTPTNAEFDTGFGSAALAQAGFIGVAYDTSQTKTYLVVSDGTDWYYTTVMTKAT